MPTESSSPTPDSSSSDGAGSSRFATTQWSLVARAANPDDSRSREALATLCERYWYPLYAFLRRNGHDAAAAQDLTQSFFLELLSKERLAQASAERGRFRSFLLAAIRNFAANERREQQTLKRGGGRPTLSLDFSQGEERYRLEPIDRLTPEKIFERRWALTVTSAALAELEAYYASEGRQKLFQTLAPYLNGGGEESYAELAERLGLSVPAIKTTVHRMRARCRDLLRAEIARTVADDADVEDELRYLFAVLAD